MGEVMGGGFQGEGLRRDLSEVRIASCWRERSDSASLLGPAIVWRVYRPRASSGRKNASDGIQGQTISLC